MPVQPYQIKMYASAFTAQNDLNAVGGVDDDSKNHMFADVENEQVQLVAEDNVNDIGTYSVLVEGENAAGADVAEVQNVNGSTPVVYTITLTLKRLFRARANNFNAAAAWCVESQTPFTTGTAQGGTSTSIQLAVGAPTVRPGMVVRLTGGTGFRQIRRVRTWDNATKIAEVDEPWSVTPDATTTYRVATGVVAPATPNLVVEVRRLFINAATPAASQAPIKYYEKFHFRNESVGNTLSNGVVSMVDPTGKLKFGLAATINDTQSLANRLAVPTGITFATTAANVPAALTLGDAIGVWVEFTRNPGDPEIDDQVVQWSLTGDP